MYQQENKVCAGPRFPGTVYRELSGASKLASRKLAGPYRRLLFVPTGYRNEVDPTEAAIFV